MKITVFIPKLTGGGAEKAAICHANSLALDGHEVTLLVLNPENPMADVSENITVIRLCRRMRTALFFLPLYIKRRKPELIISHLTVPNFICSFFCMFFPNSESIITVQNDLSYQLRKTKLKPLIELFIIRASVIQSKQIIAVSRGVKNFLIQKAFAKEKGTHLVYNPIAISEPRSEDHIKLRNKKYIIAVGRLVHQKGFDILLRAYANSQLPNRKIKLVIAGEGPLRGPLADLCKELGIEAHVEFLGYVKDLNALYYHAEFFVLSSRWEGFGNVLVEALAQETRVISFNCPSGPAEILEGLENCMLIPFDNKPDTNLANGLNIMINKKSNDEGSLSARAKMFSIEHAGKALGNVVSRLEKKTLSGHD